MKVLIWIGCFFVATILNTLLGYATGIKIGYVIFYLAVYFVAKNLCAAWDEHKEAKAKQKKTAQQQYIAVEEKTETDYINKTDTPESQIIDGDTPPQKDKIRFCRKCGEELINNSQFCRKCGTKIIEIFTDKGV